MNVVEYNDCSDQRDAESGCFDSRGNENVFRCVSVIIETASVNPTRKNNSFQLGSKREEVVIRSVYLAHFYNFLEQQELVVVDVFRVEWNVGDTIPVAGSI